MTDPVPFAALEGDAAAIAVFDTEQSARTEAALCDARFDADVARIAAILEDDSALNGLRRRGDWIYNFLQNPEHPKGLWRRLPQDAPLRPDAEWQPVFDLDAFCLDTGQDWHWRGAHTAFFDPDGLLLILSWRGSDHTRFLEWDPAARAPVPGGFDLGPERNNACWIDADTIFYSTSTGEGAATRSGWPGRVLRLTRGMAPADAPVAFEVPHDHLMAHAGAFRAPDGRTLELTIGRRVIGETAVTLYPDGMGGEGIALPTPPGTNPSLNATHYAYVAGEHGPEAPGTLVLCRVGQPGKRILFQPRPYMSVNPGMILMGERWMLWVELTLTEPALRVLDLHAREGAPVTLPLPCPAQSLWVMSHDAEPLGDAPLQLTTMGFLEPATTWLFDLDQGPSGVRFEQLTREPATFDPAGMEVRLHTAPAPDGTEIPYHIVLPAEATRPLPVLQYAYGGFGFSVPPAYARLRGPMWLARGGAYVQAYIRGGGEFGKAWHLAAKREKRPTAFEDFASVANDLVRRGYTTPERIACHGGSNGGLLCAAMLTRYPERFGAVWASVAVTDMLRYHLFPAGAGWMDEYGDPDDPGARAMLRAYSPLHNVADHAVRPYPPALIDTNENDDRVDPSHSRRFAAALHQAGQPAWYHCRQGGHGGGGSTTRAAREQALGYAFLRDALGMP